MTNDDGPTEYGLRAAVEVALCCGDALVACPAEDQVCMSRAYPRGPRIGVICARDNATSQGAVAALTIHGAHCQVVSHALLELALRRPALCLSGINKGENLGYTVHLSGTVAAAAEAANHGVPNVAVSLGASSACFDPPYDSSAWEAPKAILRQLVRRFMERGLGHGVACLNVNIPSTVTPATPWRVAAQRHLDPYCAKPPRPRDQSQPHEFAPAYVPQDIPRDCDLDVFWNRGEVSVTPIAFDLTARGPDGNVSPPFPPAKLGTRDA